MSTDHPHGDQFEFDPERSALVLIEFQKQWTEPGLYNLLIRGALRNRSVVERTRKAVQAARAAGVAVVHAPLKIDPEERTGWLATLTRGRVFTEGTPKAEFTPGVYEDGDAVAEDRYSFDAFAGSTLDSVLRSKGVETVFFAGFITDQCVARSMQTALDRGYDAYMLADLTATWNRLLQWRTERRFEERVVSSAVLTAASETAPAAQ